MARGFTPVDSRRLTEESQSTFRQTQLRKTPWLRRSEAARPSSGGGDMDPNDSALIAKAFGGNTPASESTSGTRINPNSFSAGSAKWAGRTQDSVAGADSNAALPSVRNMFKKGTGAAAGLSLTNSIPSLMDNPRTMKNRETAQDRTIVGAFDAFDRSTRQGTYDDPNSPYFEENDNAYQRQFLTQRSERGGEVDDHDYLSRAMRDGLGDEKLIQAAMRGGDADLSKKYKNLSKMGVL